MILIKMIADNYKERSFKTEHKSVILGQESGAGVKDYPAHGRPLLALQSQGGLRMLAIII